jgi:hypothetical protein
MSCYKRHKRYGDCSKSDISNRENKLSELNLDTKECEKSISKMKEIQSEINQFS